MVDVARQALAEADVVLLVLDATARMTGDDRELAGALARLPATTIAVLNKLDRVAPPALLSLMAALADLLPGREVIPSSARTGEGVPAILAATAAALPEGPRLHPEEHFTAETERFLAQELVREQVFLRTAEEVPYGCAVVIEAFTEKPDRNLLVVSATILVDRPGHKAIVIGAGGRRLREVGRRARLALEALFGIKVFLELFVRVEPGWARNQERLRQLGL
jgi:GTP-binding protein Era